MSLFVALAAARIAVRARQSAKDHTPEGIPMKFERTAKLPRCPFDKPGEKIAWKAAARADISKRGGSWYVRQYMQCENCGSRARMGRYMYDNWDFVTSVVG